MSAVAEIAGGDLDHEVAASAEPVLVDFFGYGCAPCMRLLPILEEVAAERSGRLRIVKVNAHDHAEKAASYGVRGVPNLILFRGGQPVGQRAGLIPKKDLLAWIDDTLR